MAEESDIFQTVKILEDINQADKDSASSKYIKKEEVPEQEPTSYIENISNALNIIIKRMGSIEKELKASNAAQSKDKSAETYDPSVKYSELNKKTVDTKQKTSSKEDKSEPKKLSSTLTEVEKQRYRAIFEIFSKTVGIGKFAKDTASNVATSNVVTEVTPKVFSKDIPLAGNKTKDKISSITTRYGLSTISDTPYDNKAQEKIVKGRVIESNVPPITSNSIVNNSKEVIPKAALAPLIPVVVEVLSNKDTAASSKETKLAVSSTVTEAEKQRFITIFEILGNVLKKKFDGGPEASRLRLATTDSKLVDRTLPATSKDVTSRKLDSGSKPESRGTSTNIDSLLKVLIGLALAYDVLNNNFSGIIQSLYRTVKSLGPQVSRTLSLFKRTVGPALSSIGTSIGRAASTIKEAFKGKAASIGRTLSNAASSISRVLNLESIFGKLKDKIKPVFDDVASTLGQGLIKLKDKLKDKIKPVFDDVASTLGQGLIKLKDKFKSALDDAITTLSQSISNGLTRIVDDAKSILSTAADKAAQLAKAGTSAVASVAGKAAELAKTGASAVASGVDRAASAVTSVAGKGAELAKAGVSAVRSGASKVMSSAQNALPSSANRVIDFIKSGAASVTSVAKTGASAVASGAKRAAELAKTGASAVASGAKRAASAVASVAGKGAELIKSGALGPLMEWASGVFSRATAGWGGPRGVIKKLAQVTKTVGSKLGTKIPIVGPLIELFFGKGEIEEYKKMRASNQIKSDDELYFLAGQRFSQGIAGLLGGAAGAAAAGIALNAIPAGALATALSGGAATGAATLAGGLLGDLIGRLGARVVTDFLIKPEWTRAIGKILVDSPIKEEELQDFLVKDNRVYKFNDNDEVLGMKAGGAINNLISSIIATKDKQYNVVSRQVDNIKKIIPELPSKASRQVDNIKKIIIELPSKASRQVDNIKKIIPELPNAFKTAKEATVKAVRGASNTVSTGAVNKIREIAPNISLKVNSIPATVNKAVDFASREVRDRVYSFKNKSEVLGKKPENSYDSLVSSITSTNDKQFSIATRQVRVLEEIREGIKALIAKETNNINNNYNSTNGGRRKETRPSLSPFNLRSEFDSMNNIATI